MSTSDRVIMLSLGRMSRVISVAPDGTDEKTLIANLESKPDGVAFDPVNRHLYVSFMGAVRDGEDFWERDGSVERWNLDGDDHEVIVPTGVFNTGKQIQYDDRSGRIYWCDREGLRVMSCRADGSDLTVHVQTGTSEADKQDRTRHCVGIAIDPVGGFLYWTQKGKPKGGEGRILRAPLAAAPGVDPTRRTDIEVLFDNLPEPIDLEWDGETATLYWTDRGDPPEGNTLNRASIRDGKASGHEILLSGLEEGIGLTHDRKGRRIFVSDLKGSLRVVNLDRPGSGEVIFKSKGPLTGIAYVPA